jgi:4-hydroxy-tetrahydrodipicolinate synthase
MRPDLKNKLHGVLVPVVTPMNDDFSLRLESVPRHIDYLIEAGVEVLIPCGSTGECPSLSVDERKQVARAVVESAAGRATVIAGASDTRLAAVVEVAHYAAEIGADGILVTPPYYFLPTEDQVFAFLQALDREIDLPFVFYNNPATAKINASFELIERLAELRNFGAIKENNSQPVRYYEELVKFGDFFPVIPAGEPPAVFNMLSGAPGFMSVAANFHPRLIGDMLRLAKEGRTEEAFAKFEILRRYRQLFEARNRQGYPLYVVYAKAALELMGFEVGPPRLPLTPPSPLELEELRRVLREVMELEVAA